MNRKRIVSVRIAESSRMFAPAPPSKALSAQRAPRRAAFRAVHPFYEIQRIPGHRAPWTANAHLLLRNLPETVRMGCSYAPCLLPSTSSGKDHLVPLRNPSDRPGHGKHHLRQSGIGMVRDFRYDQLGGLHVNAHSTKHQHQTSK